MKRPWLPRDGKAPGKRRCGKCRGGGKLYYANWVTGSTNSADCDRCGGKGHL